MKNSRIHLFKIVILLYLITGCANVQLAYPPSSLLKDHSGMTSQYDLDKVRIDPKAEFSNYDVLLISSVDTSNLVDEQLTQREIKEVVEHLSKSFRSEMIKYFETIAADPSVIKEGQKSVRLDLTVTELVGTDMMMNMVVGFGAGNATGTVEGRFVDVQTRKELAAFADRKKGSGFTKKEWQDQSHSLVHADYKKLKYLLLFGDTWAENVGNIVKAHKKI